MPEQVRCPSCNATLRVPETLLGKNVKCPKCQTAFLAEIEAPPEPEGIVREPAPSARRSRVPDDTEDEELPPEEEDEDRPRRRRRGRGFAAAEAAVAAPAICLMVLGGLDIPTALVYLVFQIINISQANRVYPPGQAPPGYETGLVMGRMFVFVIIPLTIFWGILLLVGGLKMKKLQSFGLVMTTCILAMLPLHCCCLLGLPFGIWGLVVLNKPEVKDAFSS
ncbi:MAG: hypothetical protein ACRELF_18240 [Gemmataceae bacterium]